MKIAIITNRLMEDSLDIVSMYFHLTIRHDVDLISNTIIKGVETKSYDVVDNNIYDVVISTTALSQDKINSIKAKNKDTKVITVDVAGYFTHDLVFGTPSTTVTKKSMIPSVWSPSVFKDGFYYNSNSITLFVDHIDPTQLESISNISKDYDVLHYSKSLKLTGLGRLEFDASRLRDSSHLIYIGKYKRGMISILMDYIHNGKVAIHNVSEWKEYGYYIEDIKTMSSKIEEIISDHEASSTYSDISPRSYKYNNSNELLDNLDLFLSDIASNNLTVRLINQETNNYV